MLDISHRPGRFGTPRGSTATSRQDRKIWFEDFGDEMID
jgi:hypothetical protein